jgi:hypothetical protein
MKKLLSVVSVIMGSLLLWIGTCGYLDPSGSKMADDGDPFGSTDVWFPMALMVLSVVLIVWPFVLRKKAS